MKKVLLHIAFAFYLLPLIGAPKPLEIDNIRFRTISPIGGITDKGVEIIIQDHLGFIWIATKEELYKYNSYSFTKYGDAIDDSQNHSINDINDLLVDKKNRLWVATDNGLNLFNRATDSFELKEPDINNPGRRFTDIECDSNGLLYLASGSRVFIYNPESETSAILSLPYNNIRKISVFEDGRILAAFHENGVYAINVSGEMDLIIPPGKSLLRTATFNDSLIFLGYEKEGLSIYKTDGTFKQTYPLEDGSISHGKINSILQDSQGNIWVGSYLGLDIIRSDGYIHHISHDPSVPATIPYSSVFKIYEDSLNNIWIGTWSGGLAYYNRYDNRFEHVKHQIGINSISNNYVSCFESDDHGNLWIGTERGGLNIYRESIDHFSNYIIRPDLQEPLNIKSLYRTKDNKTYIGTFKGGFYYLDPNKKLNRVYLEGFEPDNEKVYSIIEDERGIWLGPYAAGLFLISNKDHKMIRHFDSSNDSLGLSSRHVTALFSDDGDLWIGTNRGLNLLPSGKNHFIHYLHDAKNPASISSDVITMIKKDIHGEIWIGTRRGGLNKFLKEEKAFIHYSSHDGLSGNDANAILCDELGCLWVSSENGISRFDPKDGSVNNYYVSDGLQGNQFIPGAAHKDADGRLYFGGTNGYTIIYPTRIKINPVHPKTIIYKLVINNQEMLASTPESPLKNAISETDRINLKHFQSSVSLDFTTNNYLNPLKNKYAYRLVGLDKTWQYTHENRAVYNNLRHGDYTFELKAANNDGVWSKNPRVLHISISPPWWKHDLAYVAYILALIGLIYLLISSFLYRERMKSAVKMESLKRENEDKIHQLKLRFFTNISHEFKTPLTLILSPIQRLVSNTNIEPGVREDLLLAEKNANRLQLLVNQFIEFRKIDQTSLNIYISEKDITTLSMEVYSYFKELAIQKKIDYSLNQLIEPLNLWIDNEKIETALINILSNAFKYTDEGGQITFSIRNSQPTIPDSWRNIKIGEPGELQYIFLEISDTGKGIKEDRLFKIFERFYRADQSSHQAGSGIGLSLAKDYILLQKGYIQLASKPGEGSIFIVCIPVGKDHLFELPNVEFVDPAPSSLKDKKTVPLYEEVPVKKYGVSKVDNNNPLLLVIEDNVDLNQYIDKTLSEHFRVSSAFDAEKGLLLASRLLPELIISDIMLPGMDGLEFCDKIKSDPLTSHIPVVIITALSEDKERIQGLKMGADAYLPKPLNMQILFSTINNLLEARKNLRLAFGGIQAAVTKAEGLSAFDATLIKRARKYIEDNIANPDISTTLLASELKMSRTNLHRKLRSLVDQSTTEFVKNIRINKAMEYMENKGMNVSEACYAVGFTSTSYFSRCFKEIYGISPSEYKRNLANV